MAAAKKLLLVEDDQFLSALLSNRLQKEGFEVRLAPTGEDALTTLKTWKPDLILLDLILPGKSGFEVMEEIRQDPQLSRKAPIMILSNLGQNSDIDRAKSLGAVDYLVKARTSINEIITRVQATLNR